MRKHQSLQYILIFILAQLAWLSLLGLWIYWYVSNYLVFAETGQMIPRPVASERTNIVALVGGLILLTTVSVGMSLLFARLNIQLRITQLYDNFIANVTHELKSPLSSIQLALETLGKRRVSGRRQKEFIQLMLKDADRLNNLINSILEISGLEQKKVAHHFKIVTADSLVRTLIEETAEQFNLPRKTIRIEGRAPCRCVVDRNAMQIVFNNIIDNAIKYSAGKVRIEVLLKCSSKNMIAEFKDHGIGIAAKDQKRIFDKFHRIHSPNAPTVKGTGLGLYWVKEILEQHRGRVSVFSEGQDSGSTFRIELPIYQAFKKRHIKHLLQIPRKSRSQ